MTIYTSLGKDKIMIHDFCECCGMELGEEAYAIGYCPECGILLE